MTIFTPNSCLQIRARQAWIFPWLRGIPGVGRGGGGGVCVCVCLALNRSFLTLQCGRLKAEKTAVQQDLVYTHVKFHCPRRVSVGDMAKIDTKGDGQRP